MCARIAIIASALVASCGPAFTAPSTSKPLAIEKGKCYDVSFWGIPVEMPCHAAYVQLSDARLLVGDTVSATAWTYAGDTVTAAAMGSSVELIKSITGVGNSFCDGIAIGPDGRCVLIKTRQQYRTVAPGVSTIRATGPTGTVADARIQVFAESDIKGVSLECPLLNMHTSQNGWAKLRVLDRADSVVRTYRITTWTISDGQIAAIGHFGYGYETSAEAGLNAKRPGTATVTARIASREPSCNVTVSP